MKYLIALFLTFLLGTAYSQKLNRQNLIVDLNADKGILLSGDSVETWQNQVSTFVAKEFSRRDDGRKVPGSGRPRLLKKVADLKGHNALAFRQQELINMEEDAFDHLITGAGYTWFCILKPAKQLGLARNLNVFFGNLARQRPNEGLWAGFNDNNTLWIGSRNSITGVAGDKNNPKVASTEILKQDRYYLIMGRMDKGTDTVTLSLYLNDGAKPIASSPFPVNPKANSSRLAIGQERDATDHPGREAVAGDMARLLIYDRSLTNKEMIESAKRLIKYYGIPNK